MNLDLPDEVTVDTDEGTGLDAYRDVAMDARFLTVRALATALRRRWRVVATTVALGGVVAAVFSFLSPPAFSATTTMLVRHPESSNPIQAMTTDAQLLKTRTVAQDAIRALGLHVSTRVFAADYEAVPISDEILQLKLRAPTAREAVRRADAVAEAFLGYRRTEGQRQAKVIVDSLEERRTSLGNELAAVNDKAATTTDPKALGDLLTRRATLNDQIGQLRLQIDAALVGPTSAAERSHVLDPASADDRSPIKALIANLGAGVIAGLCLGAGGVLVSEIASDRITRREDVAALLGAPVKLSIHGFRQGRFAHRRHLLRRRAPARSADVGRVAQHFGTFLARSGPTIPSLVVVSIGSDQIAGLAITATAASLAREGHNVLLVDLSPDSTLTGMAHFPHAASTGGGSGAGAVSVVFFPSGDYGSGLGLEHDSLQPDTVLAFAVLDPALGAEYLREWAANAVAVVTAGRSSAATLTSAAIMLYEADVTLKSVVLAGADPADESVGSPRQTPAWSSAEPPAVSAST